MKIFPVLLLASLAAAPVCAATFQDTYLERYFDMYPGRATAAGRHDLDRRLEDLSPERRTAWLNYNRRAVDGFRRLMAAPSTSYDDRLDAELLLRQAELEVFEYGTQMRPERDPLFWTSFVGDATVFLLVRKDLPMPERLSRAAARASQLPRLAAQAREALSKDPSRVAPEICAIAAPILRSSAIFYREGFLHAAEGQGAKLRKELKETGDKAAAALDDLASFLEGLQSRAKGYPRLGADYAARFRLVTGVDEPVEKVLASAVAALAARRAEAAAYGRSVWKEVMPGQEPPADDRELLRRLFHRVSADRASNMDEFVADYKKLVTDAFDFVRRKGIMTLPDPPSLVTDRSPGFFSGQAVGGVYPPGPYAPEEQTLFYLPTIPDSATPEEKEAFFRDFNHNFNVMITPHEMVPGHYVQLKWASRHPRKVRALFADGVYVEGWGTFSERLLLDQGWGGPLPRLAHLKKQLENIARTIVDIRVHTQDMSRAQVLRFVKEEALQDEQFAANMWTRAITTSPQLTFYYLGDREVQGFYEEMRAAKGRAFDLKAFLDGMMEMGPVPVRHYRERMLGTVETTKP
ncbi:MAG TPA: DUF885 family protein [Thermoanaerobaculia bacterium]|jgi:uncharacterized protein (DUF885 family)|nr:DUF885 family protein [Thermoanaerobaculia bacterium]